LYGRMSPRQSAVLRRRDGRPPERNTGCAMTATFSSPGRSRRGWRRPRSECTTTRSKRPKSARHITSS
jgi:hypothetical protein